MTSSAYKIKELESTIELIRSQEKRLLKEIEELKKTRHTLYDQNISGGGYRMACDRYNWFKLMCDRNYYEILSDITIALSNFAANNDVNHTKFIWGAKGLHQKKYYIEIDRNDLVINFSTSIQKIGVVYFLDREVAVAAIQMLKDEHLFCQDQE